LTPGSTGRSESDTVDLADVGRAIRRGWRSALAFMTLGAVAATAVVFFAPPKFSGKASLVVKMSTSGTGASMLSRFAGGLNASGLVGGSGGENALGSPIETEIQILSSRAVASGAVDSLLLEARVINPRLVRPRGTATRQVVDAYALAPAFAPVRYRFTRTAGARYAVVGRDLHVVAVPGAPVALPVGTVTLRPDVVLPEFDLELRDHEDAITRLSKHLSIDKAGGEIAKIVYRGDDSLTAAAVPNMLMTIYLARRTTVDRGVDQRRVEFLTASVDSAATELSAAEHALRRQQEASGVIDPQVVGKIELESAAKMRSSLTDLQVEEGAIKQLIARVTEGSLQPRDLAAYPTFLKSAGINDLLSQLSQVETERFKLLETRTEKDPEVIALGESAKNIEGQLLPLARSYSTSVGKQRSDLEHQIDSAQHVIGGLPAVAESGLRLQHDVIRLGQVYTGVQAQLVDARLAAIQEGGDVHILDIAVPQRNPWFPQPLITEAVGIGGGLLCGLIAALFLSVLGRWMQDPQQVEQSTGFPALRFDPAIPLFISSEATQTILVLGLEQRACVAPVARQIVQTAVARSISATVLDLSSLDVPARPATQLAIAGSASSLSAQPTIDVNARIERLEQEHSLVVVQLPTITAQATVAVLRRSRPVVLVVPERHINREGLMGAVHTLRRLDVPCAGIVLSSADRNGVLGH
jgi:tyrosine-protein kinase Etk/Wzc